MIAKCINNICPKRSTCLRYLSVDDGEAFGDFDYDPKKGCGYYLNKSGWNNTPTMTVQDADRRAIRKKS